MHIILIDKICISWMSFSFTTSTDFNAMNSRLSLQLYSKRVATTVFIISEDLFINIARFSVVT
jgi:hypothetical protein